MNTKHTPGPWKIEANQTATKKRNVYEHGEKFFLMAAHRNFFSIGTIGGPSNFESQKEMRANARLIAAAPELIELLYTLQATLEDGEALGKYKTVEDMHNLISDAIQKATG